MLVSTKLGGTAGELRNNTARFLFAQEHSIVERQEANVVAATAQINQIEEIVDREVPQLSGKADALRETLSSYSTIFGHTMAAIKQVGRTPRTEALANDISNRGDALLSRTREVAAELGAIARANDKAASHTSSM